MPFDRQKCIRYYLSGNDMPERRRTHVQRILGCDICQDCCPHNTQAGWDEPFAKHAAAMNIGRILSGDIVDARELVGANYGRKKRLACHATLLVGAQRITKYKPLVENLVDDEFELLAEYARWAVQRMQ